MGNKTSRAAQALSNMADRENPANNELTIKNNFIHR
jgi:hypothetical protein